MSIFSHEDRAIMHDAVHALSSIGVEALIADVCPDVTVPDFCPECRRPTSMCPRSRRGYCGSGLHFEV